MKEIFIERQNELLRIAIKDKGQLSECYMEKEAVEPLPGEIYRGVVKSIVPAIKSAFVDIGYEKNCYLYMDTRLKNLGIKKGNEILVQVQKEGIDSKGAKVTSAVELPGRYCVLVTLNNQIDFSKKIMSSEFKDYIIKNIIKPSDIGIMIRTNAEKADIHEINAEINSLYDTYKEIKREFQFKRNIGLIYAGGGILSKILRDKLDEKVSSIYVDNETDYKYINEFVKDINELNMAIIFHNEQRTLFDAYGLEKEILTLRNSKVALKCGGFIVIEKTEAMYVIDVNSGKNVKNSSIDKTAYITNLEAAEEAARQIKLRNLAGIILIDFIDMESLENKDKVLKRLKDGFAEDKNKTVIYPFTELNLVQIGRRRIGRPIYDFLEEDCIGCQGNGKRLRFSYIKLLIKNDIIRISRQNEIKDIHIEIDSYYENRIRAEVHSFISDIGAVNKTVYLTFTDKYEYYKVEPLIFANQVENMQPYRLYG